MIEKLTLDDNVVVVIGEFGACESFAGMDHRLALIVKKGFFDEIAMGIEGLLPAGIRERRRGHELAVPIFACLSGLLATFVIGVLDRGAAFSLVDELAQ